MFLNFVLAILNQHGVAMDTQKVTIIQTFVTICCGSLLFSRYTKISDTSVMVLAGIFLLLLLTNFTNTPNVKTFYDCLIIPLYIALGASAFGVKERWMNGLLLFVSLFVGMEILAPSLYSSMVNPGAYFTATREWVGGQTANHAIDDGLYIGAYRGGGSIFSLADHRVSGPFLEPLSLGYFSIIMATYFASMYRGSLLYRLIVIGICIFLSLLSDSRAASAIIIIGTPILLLRVRVPTITSWAVSPIILLLSWSIYYFQPQFLTGDYFYRIGLTFEGMDQITIADLVLGRVPIEHMFDSGYSYLLHCVTPLGVFPIIWYCCGLFTRRRNSNPTIFLMLSLYATTTLLLGGAFFSIKTASLLGYIIGIAGLGTSPLQALRRLPKNQFTSQILAPEEIPSDDETRAMRSAATQFFS
ncbi:hypothetical protein [Sphingomonas abietis]|uniref:Uncharacterized protein n=1 Tax=Sphingomonas abietis TaxID=3012344 RepID=A0ABY7NH30_9SPHN|nr:hypothetical protein [Sphingomonas abietis]WBO20847.1 hypothetical protein PBT88_11550 [Sphingomonas abietis]